MKRVLWISRHQMTPEQWADLERAMGDTVVLACWTDTVKDLGVLRPLVEWADAVAAVLPVELLSELVKLAGARPVLQAVSGRQPTGRTHTLPDGREEPEFAFVHRCWQQILRLELETRDLSGEALRITSEQSAGGKEPSEPGGEKEAPVHPPSIASVPERR